MSIGKTISEFEDISQKIRETERLLQNIKRKYSTEITLINGEEFYTDLNNLNDIFEHEFITAHRLINSKDTSYHIKTSAICSVHFEGE